MYASPRTCTLFVKMGKRLLQKSFKNFIESHRKYEKLYGAERRKNLVSDDVHRQSAVGAKMFFDLSLIEGQKNEKFASATSPFTTSDVPMMIHSNL